MTLSFTQKWPNRMQLLKGQQNLFVEKIIASFPDREIDRELANILIKINIPAELFLNVSPKIHTIRQDKPDRWKAGNKIHFVINNRTKERFQFFPIVECVSVQKFEIAQDCGTLILYIDDMLIAEYNTNDLTWLTQSGNMLHEIARNDGFDSIDDFFQYFNEPFTGKIIHWTNLTY